jgi:hypothetical protein
MALFKQLLRLHKGNVPLEDFFTEIVAYFLNENRDILFSWFDYSHILESGNYVGATIATQKTYKHPVRGDEKRLWIDHTAIRFKQLEFGLSQVFYNEEELMIEVVEIPVELTQFNLPQAVQDRLQLLLDRQDQGHGLSIPEQKEAEGLVELAEFLSLLRLRATRVMKQA